MKKENVFLFKNAEVIYELLLLLCRYEDCKLTFFVFKDVAIQLIQKGLYKPTKVSEQVKQKWKQDIELEIEEAETIFEDNPQSHKEAGFEEGWASRFDTWFKIAKELGFVYYWQNEKIVFSESGKMLLDKETPQNEQLVFANAFAKYQRNNPFRRVLNENVPLILLLQTIRLLNADADFNGAGMAKREIPLLLCWQNNDAQSLYKTIKRLRKKHGYNISDEIILEECCQLLDDTKRDDSSILSDYPDDFIRKMRLTGLISLRGGGRFLDINTKEIEAVNYVLTHYINYPTFTKEKDFFEYMGKLDKTFIAHINTYKAPVIVNESELDKWVSYYSWETIKKEMLLLATNTSSKDDILKMIDRPLRLEFLTSLALLKKLPNVKVKPNFISDDEGLPTSFASGNTPDIECNENKETALVEVTLLTGTQQHIRESFSIQRHLETFLEQGRQAYTLFISPKAFVDTCRYAKFISVQYQHEVSILDIALFVTQLESNKTLKEVAYTASSCNK